MNAHFPVPLRDTVTVTVIGRDDEGGETQPTTSSPVPSNASLLEPPVSPEILEVVRARNSDLWLRVVWRYNAAIHIDPISLPRNFTVRIVREGGSTSTVAVESTATLDRVEGSDGEELLGVVECTTAASWCVFSAEVWVGAGAGTAVVHVTAENDGHRGPVRIWESVFPPPTYLISVWRPVGEWERVVVRWRFRERQDDDSSFATDSFVLESIPLSGESLETQVPRSVAFESKQGIVVFDEETGKEIIEDWEIFSGTVTSGSARPVRVRVRAENCRGSGPTAEWPGAVVANCLESEFLANHEEEPHSWVCRECPSAAVCGGLPSRNMTARAGYWRVPWAEHGIGFIPCRKASACKGWEGPLGRPADDGSDLQVQNTTRVRNTTQVRRLEAPIPLGGFDDLRQHSPVAVPGLQLHSEEHEGCTEGHAGVLCGACESGYYEDISGSCARCGSVASAWTRFVLIAAALLVMLSVLLVRAVKQGGSNRSKGVQVLKVMATHLQTVAIVAGVGVDWPGAVQLLNSVASASSSVSAEGMSFECLLGSEGKDVFVRAGLIMIAAPIFFVLYCLVFWAAWKLKRGGSWTQWRQRVQTSLLVMGFLFHAPITRVAFQLVTCEAVHAPGDDANAQLRLTASLDVRCDDPASLVKMLGLSLPIFLLLSIGLPLFASLRLYSLRRRLDDPTIRQVWGFMFVGFRSHAILWESVVMVRKVGLAATTVVLAAQGPLVQIAGAMLVTVGFSFLHSWIKPYDSQQMNRLEMSALICAALTLFVAQLLVAEAASGVLVAMVVIISANAILVLWALWILGRTATKKGWCMRCCRGRGWRISKCVGVRQSSPVGENRATNAVHRGSTSYAGAVPAQVNPLHKAHAGERAQRAARMRCTSAVPEDRKEHI